MLIVRRQYGKQLNDIRLEAVLSHGTSGRLAMLSCCTFRSASPLAQSEACFWMISDAPNTGFGACVTWQASIRKVPFRCVPATSFYALYG